MNGKNIHAGEERKNFINDDNQMHIVLKQPNDFDFETHTPDENNNNLVNDEEILAKTKLKIEREIEGCSLFHDTNFFIKMEIELADIRLRKLKWISKNEKLKNELNKHNFNSEDEQKTEKINDLKINYMCIGSLILAIILLIISKSIIVFIIIAVLVVLNYKFIFSDMEHFTKAIIYYLKGKYGKAIILFNASIKNVSGYFVNYLHKVKLFYYTKNYNKAIETLNEAIKIQQKSNTFINIAKSLFHLNKFNESNVELQKAINIDTKNLKAHYMMGNNYSILNMLDEAIKEFGIVKEILSELSAKSECLQNQLKNEKVDIVLNRRFELGNITKIDD